MKRAPAHARPFYLYAVTLGGLPSSDSRFDFFEQTHGFPFFNVGSGTKKAPAIFVITKTTDALNARYSIFFPTDPNLGTQKEHPMFSCFLKNEMLSISCDFIDDYLPGIGGGVSSSSPSKNGESSGTVFASAQDSIPFFHTRLSGVSFPSLTSSLNSS